MVGIDIGIQGHDHHLENITNENFEEKCRAEFLSIIDVNTIDFGSTYVVVNVKTMTSYAWYAFWTLLFVYLCYETYVKIRIRKYPELYVAFERPVYDSEMGNWYLPSVLEMIKHNVKGIAKAAISKYTEEKFEKHKRTIPLPEEIAPIGKLDLARKYQLLPAQLIEVNSKRILGSGIFGRVYSGKIIEGEKMISKDFGDSAKNLITNAPMNVINKVTGKVGAVAGGVVDAATELDPLKLAGTVADNVVDTLNPLNLVDTLNPLNLALDPVDIAVKILKDDPSKESIDELYHEIYINNIIMERIDEADKEGREVGIVRMKGFYIPPQTFPNNFFGRRMFVSDFMGGGDLKKRLIKWKDNSQKSGLMPVDKALDFIGEIASGLAYLHDECKIVHGDLAARNILVDSQDRAKVADFTASAVMKEEPDTFLEQGKPYPWKWMAAELYTTPKNPRPFTDKYTDLWSFGVIMWEIFTYGNSPYMTIPNAKLRDYILDTNGRLPPPYPGFSEKIYLELMCPMWYTNKFLRPSYEDIFKAIKRCRGGNLLGRIKSFERTNSKDSQKRPEGMNKFASLAAKAKNFVRLPHSPKMLDRAYFSPIEKTLGDTNKPENLILQKRDKDENGPKRANNYDVLFVVNNFGNRQNLGVGQQASIVEAEDQGSDAWEDDYCV